jgi:hypothetical protein
MVDEMLEINRGLLIGVYERVFGNGERGRIFHGDYVLIQDALKISQALR